jgi:hypothetical protein
MVEPAQTPERRGPALIFGLVLFFLVLFLTFLRALPPDPLPATAPPTAFSAERAAAVLRTLLGDASPHPIGSPANAAVRGRVVDELRRLGYAPEVEEGVACSPGGSCGRVSNVVARLDGAQPGKAVLAAAHYDSVPAGPGVSDDLSGVAALLETARALKAGPPPRHSVIFLIDDGEEAGLLGAELFAAQHPAMKEVAAMVNLEARGTAGPSLMFETSGDDAWMVSRFASAAPRPVTSSLFVTIYKMLPNDTDLSVFKRRGLDGLNFAFIEGSTHYHTPTDDLKDLSPGTLQHHGDNALAAISALAAADLASPPRGNAVFFDVLGFFVVRWPQGLTLVLALVALALVIAAAVLLRRRGASGSGIGWGVLGFVLSVLFAGALAWLLSLLLRGAMPAPWIARPLPALMAYAFLALAASGAVAVWTGRRAGAAGVWTGVWIVWSVLGVVLAVVIPGASYLFVVPALVAGVCGLIGRSADVGLIPATLAAALWLPLLRPIYFGLGTPALLVVAVLTAILLTGLAPFYVGAGALRRWVPIAAAVLALVLAARAWSDAPFSPSSPQPVTVLFHQDGDAGAAHWVARGTPLPPALRQAARFGARPEAPFPWLPNYARLWVAPAEALSAPAPQLAVIEGGEDGAAGGKRHLKLRLTSPRGAQDVTLAVPSEAKLESISMAGQEVPLGAKRKNPRALGQPFQFYTFWTLPPEGTEIDVVLGDPRPLDWYVVDRTPGLPSAGAPLLQARPATAAPSQEGDSTLVSRKVKI